MRFTGPANCGAPSIEDRGVVSEAFSVEKGTPNFVVEIATSDNCHDDAPCAVSVLGTMLSIGSDGIEGYFPVFRHAAYIVQTSDVSSISEMEYRNLDMQISAYFKAIENFCLYGKRGIS